MYRYGEEISYSFKLIETDDYDNLQSFVCGNKRLDWHIHNEVIMNGEVVNEDGLYFKFVDENTKEIIAVVSLATSGILFQVGRHMHTLPAIKIDVLAVDIKYQKIHYDKNSESDQDRNNHYYFSDDIICTVIAHCRELSESRALVNFIVLYADEKAYRYYERNNFLDFNEYMVQEHNMEIDANIPMYLRL